MNTSFGLKSRELVKSSYRNDQLVQSPMSATIVCVFSPGIQGPSSPPNEVQFDT